MRIFCSLSLLLLTFSMLAQGEISFRQDTFYVMSLDGLNMRMNPDLESVVLTAIPYGGRVKIIDSKSYGELTLGKHQICGPDENCYDIPVTGHWVRVAFAGKEGFVFSPYLIDSIPDEEEGSSPNGEYVLLFPGQFCDNNLPAVNSYYWYGGYEEEAGQVRLRSVDPSFFLIQDIPANLIMSFGDNERLRFVIGRKTPWPISEASGVFDFHIYGGRMYRKDASDRMLQDAQLVQASDSGWDLIRGSTIQRLSVPVMKNGTPNQLMTLYWHGDLDGDGLADYICSFGEKVRYIVLFLSSEAQPGQIAHPVAIFNTGYCC